jgi:antitoxin YefM
MDINQQCFSRGGLQGVGALPRTRTIMGMNTMDASEAGEKLYQLLDETARDHEPLLITGPRSNAVLVGEEDWNSMQETLGVLSVPGMRESIRDGLETAVEDCEKEPGW